MATLLLSARRREVLGVKSKGYAALGGSVAAVAIAALGGPLPPVAIAGVTELVSYVRAFYEKGGDARDLQRAVEKAVLPMVEDSREFRDPESGRIGLAEAAWTIAHHGVSDERSAEIGWDPARAAAEVIKAARHNSRYWNAEGHYPLAEEAIRVTYQVLYRQVRDSEKVLIPAIRAARGDIDRRAAALSAQLQAQGAHVDARLDTVEERLVLLDDLAGLLEGLTAQLAELSGQVADVAARLPRRLEGAYGATLQEMLRALHERLPDGALTARDTDVAAITAFATGREGYRWLAGGAFTGKTALMLHAVTGALPDTVDVVSYFLRQVASDADSTGFLTAVVPQLAELCGVAADSLDEHTYRRLWQMAAEQAHDKGRHLLLVVDGLDEDLLPPGRPSVAALLPDLVAGRGAEAAHVHVTGRPYPELPTDLAASNPGHPLHQIARNNAMDELDGFPGWEDLRDLGLAEIDALIRGGGLRADLVGLMAAAAGPLADHDLAALHFAPAPPRREDRNEVRRILTEVRSFDRVGPADRRRYQFAHATLLEHAQSHQDLADPDHPARLDPYFRTRLHAWADRWQQAGWPAPDDGIGGTPRYLLDTYPATLADDPSRRASLAEDVGWVDTAIRMAGVDRVLGTLQTAAAVAGGGRGAELAAVVAALQISLRRPYPVSDPAYALRLLALQSLNYGYTHLAAAARARLQALPDPGPVPMWTTRRDRPPALELGGHDGAVQAVVVAADGRIVTGGQDGRVLLWDLERPGHPVVLGGHDGAVQAVVVLTDGRIVTGGQDGRIRLWDPEQAGLPLELGQAGVPILRVSGDEDGEIITLGQDGRILLWDLEHPGQALELHGPSPGEEEDLVAVVPEAEAQLSDGRIVTGGQNGRVLLWDPDQPYQDIEIGAAGSPIQAVVVADGRIVTGGQDGRVLLWDLERPGHPVVLGGHDGAVQAVVVLTDGRIVTGGQDGRIRLWDPEAAGQTDQPQPDAPLIMTVLVLTDGRIVTGGQDGRVLLWDPSSKGPPVELGQAGGPVQATTVLTDGRIVTGGQDGRVLLWDPSSKSPPVELGYHGDEVTGVTVLADGLIVAGGLDGEVWLWDPEAAGQAVRVFHAGSPDPAVAVLRDGRIVTVSNRVRLWDPEQPSWPVELGQTGGAVQGVGVLANGRIVTGGVDGRVQLWDPKQAGRTVELGQAGGPVQVVVVLPDVYIVTGGVDGRVQLWDPGRPGRAVHDVPLGQISHVSAARVGGSAALVTAGDRGLTWWDVPLDPAQPDDL